MNLRKNNILSILSGIILSISLTVIGILLFAVLLRFVDISDAWIFPINQVIKLISLFFGMWAVIKKTKEKGFINGLIFGLIYFVINFILFSILQGSFAINLNNLFDLLLTSFSSGIIGIILVHIVK